jgi:phage terminase large subunit-like protein
MVLILRKPPSHEGGNITGRENAFRKIIVTIQPEKSKTCLYFTRFGKNS